MDDNINATHCELESILIPHIPNEKAKVIELAGKFRPHKMCTGIVLLLIPRKDN